MNWPLLINSLLVAGMATLLSVALGGLVALRLVTVSRRWRNILWVGALATLSLPPFLVVNAWMDLFGASGALRTWLPVPLYSAAGAVTILTTLLWPLGTLFMVGSWDRVEPAQMESDPRLRGIALLRWVLWPAARGSLGLGAVLTFVIAFNQFTVPVILQVPVFPEELWLALTTRLNNAGAWASAGPMAVIPCLVLLALRSREIEWPRWSDHSGEQRAITLVQRLGPGWKRLATAATAVALGVGLVLPLGQLAGQPRTWTELSGLWDSSGQAIGNSFLLAFLTASGVLGAGILLRRRRSGSWLWLAFFIPGILISQALARGLASTVLYGTFVMVILVFVLHYVAIGWQGAAEATRACDRDLLDAGRLEGVRGWRWFRHYAWPQMARPLSIAWYTTYLLALWDVETLVLILPPGGDTLPLRIFQLLHYGHNAQVNAMCLVLLGLALAPLLIWKAGVFVADLGRGG